MSNNTCNLALFLDAPLQSWGYQSKFDQRTTLSYPTRSGLLGMVCAAMGIERDDQKRLDELTELRLSIYAFRQEGRLIDYHTVGGGWDKKHNRQHIVPKADGSVGNTVVTHREYLQNARFGVVVEGGGKLLERIAAALRDPKWGIWLGRKSCIPATPVEQGIFNNHNDALARLSELAGADPRRTVEEVEQFQDGTDTIQDKPLNFSTREFAPRRVNIE